MNKNQKIFGIILGVGVIGFLAYKKFGSSTTTAVATTGATGTTNFTGFANATGCDIVVNGHCGKHMERLMEIRNMLDQKDKLYPAQITQLKNHEMQTLSMLQKGKCGGGNASGRQNTCTSNK